MTNSWVCSFTYGGYDSQQYSFLLSMSEALVTITIEYAEFLEGKCYIHIQGIVLCILDAL